FSVIPMKHSTNSEQWSMPTGRRFAEKPLCGPRIRRPDRSRAIQNYQVFDIDWAGDGRTILLMNLTIFTHHRYIRLKPASMYSSKASITMPTPTRSCAVKYSSATQTPSINASSGVINVTSDTTLADKRLRIKKNRV